MTKKWCYNKFVISLFSGKRRWRQEKTIEWSNFISFLFLFLFCLFYFQNCPFWTYNKRINTFIFWCMVHIWFTPSEGPLERLCQFICLKKSDHGSWTVKSDHGKRPSSKHWLRGPWCRLALRCVTEFSSTQNQIKKKSPPLTRSNCSHVYSERSHGRFLTIARNSKRKGIIAYKHAYHPSNIKALK